MRDLPPIKSIRIIVNGSVEYDFPASMFNRENFVQQQTVCNRENIQVLLEVETGQNLELVKE